MGDERLPVVFQDAHLTNDHKHFFEVLHPGLVQLTKEHGGSFHVSRISIEGNGNNTEDDIELEPEELNEKPSTRIVTAMEEMIAIFERTVAPSWILLRPSLDMRMKKSFSMAIQPMKS